MSKTPKPADVMDCIALGLPLSALDTKAEASESSKHDLEQLDIALQGTYEAESILSHMLKHLSDEPEHAWARAFVLRLHALNGLCMSALSGQQFDETERMREALEGIK